MNQGITIRMGAAHYHLRTGDVLIDLSTAGGSGRYETRRTLIETLKTQGYFGKRQQRKARFRQARAAA